MDDRLGDRGYVAKLEDNLLVESLRDDTRREFNEADGDELREKMRALHSSSALVVNVFEYWRDSERDRKPLAGALGLSTDIESICFERKMPSGLRGNPPNLDVMFALSDGRCLAVESKYLEPYGSHRGGFAASYRGEWERNGFTSCEQSAEDLRSGHPRYSWLSAEQLLRHILGLANQPKGCQWGLLYLWYALPALSALSTRLRWRSSRPWRRATAFGSNP